MQDPSRLLKADRKLESIWAASSIAAQVKLRQQDPRSPLLDDDSSSSPEDSSPADTSQAVTYAGPAKKVAICTMILPGFDFRSEAGIAGISCLQEVAC